MAVTCSAGNWHDTAMSVTCIVEICTLERLRQRAVLGSGHGFATRQDVQGVEVEHFVVTDVFEEGKHAFDEEGGGEGLLVRAVEAPD
eukprot:2757728-Rhodomonas_salina.3